MMNLIEEAEKKTNDLKGHLDRIDWLKRRVIGLERSLREVEGGAYRDSQRIGMVFGNHELYVNRGQFLELLTQELQDRTQELRKELDQ